MPPVDITPEQTPNPNAIKLELDRQLHDQPQPRTFYSREAAQADPLAQALFDLKHVTGVMISNHFITVSKSDEGRWRTLKPKMIAILHEHLDSD